MYNDRESQENLGGQQSGEAHEAGVPPRTDGEAVFRNRTTDPSLKAADAIAAVLRPYAVLFGSPNLRCMLKPDDFDGNCIRRVNQKNQETVLIPLPPSLKSELDQLHLNGGYYFLRGESEKYFTQTDAWRSILNDAFKDTVPDFHAHRFRHTAAVNWLLAGLSLEEVAALLGNSVKVVERHYASFCPARQESLQKKTGEGVEASFSGCEITIGSSRKKHAKTMDAMLLSQKLPSLYSETSICPNNSQIELRREDV